MPCVEPLSYSRGTARLRYSLDSFLWKCVRVLGHVGPSVGPLCPPDLDGMMPIALRDVEEEVLQIDQAGLDALDLLSRRG